MQLTKNIKARMVRSIMGDIKFEDIAGIARQEVLDAAIAALPPAVRRIYDDSALHPYVKHNNYHTDCGKIQGSIPTDFDGWLNLRQLAEIIGEAAVEKLKDRCREVRQQQDGRAEMIAQLEANFATVRTAKAFRERFPELAKYLPAEPGGTANLPATNDLVDRLKAAGLQLEQEAA